MSEEIIFKSYISSPLGQLPIYASEKGIRALLWSEGDKARINLQLNNCKVEENEWIALAKQELSEYFEGRRKPFSVPLDPIGTPFQKQVWEQLILIPFGTTKSYGTLSQILKIQNGARAVGLANGKNPISIIVPCHRVIGKDGNLTGFAGGLDAKRQLLKIEGYKDLFDFV